MQMVVGGAGDENPARIAQLLQAGGNVHAIAEKIVALDDDIAQIDADPEHDAAVRRNFGLMCGDLFLQRDREGCGVHDRAEFGDRAIAHQFDDAAVMLGQQRIDESAPKSLDRGQRAILVSLGQARIADDVRRHDRCQPPFDLDYPMVALPGGAPDALPGSADACN